MVNFCSLPKLSAVVLPQRTHNPGVVTVEDTNQAALKLLTLKVRRKKKKVQVLSHTRRKKKRTRNCQASSSFESFCSCCLTLKMTGILLLKEPLRDGKDVTLHMHFGVGFDFAVVLCFPYVHPQSGGKKTSVFLSHTSINRMGFHSGLPEGS